MIRAVPRDLRGKLEPAELFHQLLDHRWYLSQNTGHSVPLAEALTSYIETILRHRRDEMTVVAPVTGLIDVPVETSAMPIISPDDDEEDWRAKV